MSYDKYKVAPWLPPGTSGDWTIARFTVTPEDEKFGRMRAAFGNDHGRYTPTGDYTWLKHHDHTVMSDTPDEIRDHFDCIFKARGRVLIHGLGLGMVAAAVLNKPEVEHVTIVELSEDVIALVKPHLVAKFGGARLDIVHGDALTWKPPAGSRWDVAWHDIWPDICEDNLEDMKKLHRRFGRRTNWQGSWAREIIEARR